MMIIISSFGVSMSKHEKDVVLLTNEFDKSQWNHKIYFEKLKNLPIITREDLRNTRMKKGLYSTTTSGSTGETLTIEKSYADYIWYYATNIREVLWRKWDSTKNYAIIKPRSTLATHPSWGIPHEIFPKQGKIFRNGHLPIKELESWLESINPHYIHARPSILKELDLSKITNLIDTKGTGELGGSSFSSEECGTIAITCPDNPNVYHVMENQIVEVDTDGGMIITTLTNPYIRRYKNGDCIELGECTCGRSLQTITKIHGRVRNMFVLPNGDKKWALFGTQEYYSKFGIKKYKLIQTSLTELELHIISENLGEREEELKKHILKFLDSLINITIKYVDNFPDYKFEEFISLVNT
jgi:phenylacetate-CoA ligase